MLHGVNNAFDFNPIGYIDRTEITKIEWKVKSDKGTLSLLGLRPILTLPQTTEGILNISANITLEGHKSIQGHTNIYVVQQKNKK